MTICYEPDGRTVCRYQGVCHESRRQVQALTIPPVGPFRGDRCWAYQMLEQRMRPEQDERHALQEGA